MKTAGHHHGGLLRRVRSVGVLTLVSRVLGLLRDGIMAAQFGNAAISDAFALAFRLPNMARQLFGEGALSTAFLPVFLRDREQGGDAAAQRTGTAVLLVIGVALSLLVLTTEIAIAVASRVFELPYEARLVLDLLALLTPYLMLVCVVAQASAIMHGLGQFTIPALFPIALNACWIAVAMGLGLTALDAEGRIYGVSIGIVVIGLLQVLLCVPALRMLGFQFHWDWAASRDRVIEIGRTMLPVVLGLSITQLNTVSDSIFAWLFTAPVNGEAGWLTHYPLTEGTTHAMYLGQRMLQFPIGVFGAALGTVIYPVLTLHAERKQFDLFRVDLTRGLQLVIAIGVPASVGLVLIAEPLTAALFQRGNFDQADVSQTAGIIAMYALGVWAACGLMIAQRAFYACGDRATPLRVGLWIAGLNVLLNLTLIYPFGARGVALATSIATSAQCVLTVWLLHRRTSCIDWRELGRSTLRTVIATTFMIGAFWLVDRVLQQSFEVQTSRIRLLIMTIDVTAAIATFAGIGWLIGLKEPVQLFRAESAARDPQRMSQK